MNRRNVVRLDIWVQARDGVDKLAVKSQQMFENLDLSNSGKILEAGSWRGVRVPLQKQSREVWKEYQLSESLFAPSELLLAHQ
jgi:hypothetical protein